MDLKDGDTLVEEAPHSQHYKHCAIEPIQYIEANGLGFHEGNIIKYVSRWRNKDGLADLQKAKFYIERLIEQANHQQERDFGVTKQEQP